MSTSNKKQVSQEGINQQLELTIMLLESEEKNIMKIEKQIIETENAEEKESWD